MRRPHPLQFANRERTKKARSALRLQSVPVLRVSLRRPPRAWSNQLPARHQPKALFYPVRRLLERCLDTPFRAAPFRLVPLRRWLRSWNLKRGTVAQPQHPKRVNRRAQLLPSLVLRDRERQASVPRRYRAGYSAPWLLQMRPAHRLWATLKLRHPCDLRTAIAYWPVAVRLGSDRETGIQKETSRVGGPSRSAAVRFKASKISLRTQRGI